MKNLKSALKIYLSLSLLSVLTYACCEEINLRISASGYHNTYDFNTAQNFNAQQTAMITGPFSITINHEIKSTTALNHLSFSSSAYALSCPENILNQIIPQSLHVYCDQSFVYKGDSIAPGTELKTLEGLNTEVFWGEISLFFTDTLMNEVEFDSAPYLLNVEVQTDDGMQLKNSIPLQFDLD